MVAVVDGSPVGYVARTADGAPADAGAVLGKAVVRL